MKTQKTHCRQGHPFNEQNTMVKFRESGAYRVCKICRAEYARRFNAFNPRHPVKNIVKDTLETAKGDSF